MIEYELFSAIKPREFVGLAWMKEDKETRAPNLFKIAKWSNHVVYWITSEIVSIRDDPKKRIATFEKFVSMGHVSLFYF